MTKLADKQKLLNLLASNEQREKELDTEIGDCRDAQTKIREELWSLQPDSFKEGDKIVNAKGAFGICRWVSLERDYNKKDSICITGGTFNPILKDGKLSLHTRRIYSFDGWKKAP